MTTERLALPHSFDEELHSFLGDARTRLPDATLLIDEIERMVDAGGKRLRPSFCYWAYRASGSAYGPGIVRAASALELLHTFAIIHDDIMDDAEMRRGLPSVHAIHGVSIAILAGDLALVLADEMFMRADLPRDALARAFEAYSRMRQEVIQGQLMDLRSSDETEMTEKAARRIAIMKSGRYTVEEPLAIGVALADGSSEIAHALSVFGAPLGEAFQLTDDLNGVFGEPEGLGKPVDSDIREGKRHLLYAKAIAALDGEDRLFLESNWGRGRELNPDEVDRCRSLLETSGARRSTEALVDELLNQALAALDRGPMPAEVMRNLQSLADLATRRPG